tara:strand:- start:212 stop:481 length:270 start_codon:yes stop_codon:yes gene_type:complete
MTKIVNIHDFIDIEKLGPYQTLLLQSLKESCETDFNPTQICILAIDDSRVHLLSSFNKEDESSLIMAKGYLDVLQSQATKRFEDKEDDR